MLVLEQLATLHTQVYTHCQYC